MKKAFSLLSLTFLLAALSSSSARATTIFTTPLTAANEVPPTTSLGTGFAMITLENDNNTLDVTVSFSGLTGPATMAHIHCCTAPGTNTGVVLPFTNFPAANQGSYTQSFLLSSNLSGITAAAFLSGVQGGMAYVNIHTAQFPGGEIRGFLTAVPEPSTAGIAGLCLIGVFAARRRTRRSH